MEAWPQTRPPATNFRNLVRVSRSLVRSNSENCTLQVQCQVKVVIPQSLEEHEESMAPGWTPKLSEDGRREKMKYM